MALLYGLYFDYNQLTGLVLSTNQMTLDIIARPKATVVSRVRKSVTAFTDLSVSVKVTVVDQLILSVVNLPYSQSSCTETELSLSRLRVDTSHCYPCEPPTLYPHASLSKTST